MFLLLLLLLSDRLKVSKEMKPVGAYCLATARRGAARLSVAWPHSTSLRASSLYAEDEWSVGRSNSFHVLFQNYDPILESDREHRILSVASVARLTPSFLSSEMTLSETIYQYNRQ